MRTFSQCYPDYIQLSDGDETVFCDWLTTRLGHWYCQLQDQEQHADLFQWRVLWQQQSWLICYQPLLNQLWVEPFAPNTASGRALLTHLWQCEQAEILH
ncbi:hypothetical protein VST7929_00105 [Vibrio stylophorae]|uniref:Uncharacterized protein n=1 Tax=Vibrio stylophorae TaxID=659351 RepID=A0ABM8ZQW5_9VIBR|nr:hypothetical protein [Vibrio stylophorae]CAH0532289.1 hypothetical protein VST7929_00105 [Vibrio stylophorae]